MWKVTVCARSGELVTRAACLACHAGRLEPICACDPTAPYRPTGPACCICGGPSDGGAYNGAPLCFDCYVRGDPAHVTATTAAWQKTHGGTQ
jgi:hypothetical protein